MAKKGKDPNAPSVLGMLRRYLSINRKNAGVMGLSIAFTVAASLFIGLRSYFFGALVDQAQQGLLAGFAAVLPLFLAQVGFIPMEILQGNLTATFANRSLTRMRTLTFERVAHAEMQALERHKTGDLISRVNRDMEVFVGNISRFLNWDLPGFARFFVALGISLAISWQLTLISYAAIPVLGFAMSRMAKPMAKYSMERNNADGEAMALANNLIGGFALAKSYALEGAMQERFDSSMQRAVQAGIKASMVDFSLRPMQRIIQVLPYALVLGMGAYFVSTGGMQMGDVLTFFMLSDYVLAPMQGLPWMFRNLYDAAGAAQRVFEVWDMPQEQEGKGGIRPDLTAAAPVALENVSFAYHEGAQLLQGMSFSLKPGERVALVGASGCGKSTALKLLLAFYRQQSGSVRTMGADSRDYALEDLRRLFSYVGQDAYLFPGTIWENVKMARPEATDEEIRAALRASRTDDLDAQAEIGERGTRLSGGQRQRVCIARAMLKDAPILLLDEPTSALDTESEYLVTQALEELMRGKTVLLVAHRLSAMRGVDRILCIEKGRIVEEGTHEELMQSGGLYHRLYQAQTKEEEGAAS